MMQPPPRHYVPAAALAGVGEPHDRLARLAARRAFVELKSDFLDAVAGIPGAHGEWLRQQVRRTQEPVDLWLLRGLVFAELGKRDDHDSRWRQTLRRGLDSMFPATDPPSGFAVL
jgi:hypothetical protein